MAKFRSGKKSGLRTFRPKGRTIPAATFECVIERLAGDGRGVATVAGKTVFIAGALPGEKVTARYTSAQRRFLAAECIEVLDASPERAEPECPYYGQCGGCGLQHLSYSGQLQYKQQQLQHLIGRLSGSPAPEWAEPVAASAFSYRHRARFAIQAGKQQFRFGFKQRESHQVVDVERCVLLYPGLNQLLTELRCLLSSLRQRSSLLECAVNEDESGLFSVQLWCKSGLGQQDCARLEAWAQQAGLNLRVIDTASQRVVLTVDATTPCYRLAGEWLTIRYQPGDFTQVNPAVNRKMVARALQWLDLSPDDVVADYFCGVGNFTLPIAGQVMRVSGYELVPEMVAKATANALANQCSNAAFEVADLFSGALVIDPAIDKVLLDPPRAGAQALCSALAQSKVSTIVYVSCNPSTLARDLELLLAGGFTLTDAGLVDMFPQTVHSEAMVCLRCS